MQHKSANARWSCRGSRTCLGLVLVAAIIASTAWWAQALPPPPATKIDKVVDTLHGVEIVDPYTMSWPYHAFLADERRDGAAQVLQFLNRILG